MATRDQSLTEALSRACEGDRESAQQFFEQFLTFDLFVPKRHQDNPVTFSPPYPNDVVSILGVQDGERVIVPIFSSRERLLAWSPELSLAFEISGAQVMQRIPDGWWACLNPGSECEKEFSPWEIQELRGGSAAIPGIVEEMFPELLSETTQICPLQSEDAPALVEKLRPYFETESDIVRAFLAQEKSRSDDAPSMLLIGVEVSSHDNARIKHVSEELQAIADCAQIGQEKARVLVGSAVEGNVLLGLFKNCVAVYSRSSRGQTAAGTFKSLLARVWRT